MNKWNSKRIAFVSILIAMSISFVIIGTQVAALSSFPSFKLSLAGLPIKIIGYLFGPVTGFLTGMITDLLSFLFIPAFYFPLYSIALGISGAVPGLVAIIFNYFYGKLTKEKVLNKLKRKRIYLNHEINLVQINSNSDTNPKHINKLNFKLEKLNEKILRIDLLKKEKYQIDFAFYTGVFIILFSLAIITSMIFINLTQSSIDEYFEDKGILKLFSNKFWFAGIIWLGIGSGLFLLVIFKFKMNQKSFLTFVPLLMFVLITEYANLGIIAYADEKTLKIPFMSSFVASLFGSPIKIWMNLIIISFAIKIVLPLIEKKTFNGYA